MTGTVKKRIRFIDEVKLKEKKILLRVDFNVSLTKDGLSIADDARIRKALPTIEYLLEGRNKLILVSHLGRPEGRDKRFSLQIVVDYLNKLIPQYRIKLINDFLSREGEVELKQQKDNEILFLENIRFYSQEKKGDLNFAKKLASLAQAYVNDAFGVSHRIDASVVGVAKYLPSYGGLLLKKEIESIAKLINKPRHPVVAIIGGAKISTKINLLNKLLDIADYLIIGGGLANTFLCAQGYSIGKSFCEYEKVEDARKLLFLVRQKNKTIVLPTDVVIGRPDDAKNGGKVVKITDIKDIENNWILDIGPETEVRFGTIIANAKTIVWNGPMGFFENSFFRRGTDFVFYAVANNDHAYSLVGGGDTLAAISKKEYLNKITHISTGGGAMLEFIEKGTLPGIEVLKQY